MVRHALAGSVLVGVSCLLFIFLSVGNTSVKQNIPRRVRFLSVSTFGIGHALSNNSTASPQATSTVVNLYGDPYQQRGQRTPGDGLREYYTWGLWNQCAGYGKAHNLQYCDRSKFARSFKPTNALLQDVPSSYQSSLGSLLSTDSIPIKTDKRLGDWSKLAGCMIFIGLLHLFVLIPLASLVAMGRDSAWMAMCALVMSTISFLCFLISASVWAGLIRSMRKLNGITVPSLNNVELGLKTQIGSGFWLLWVCTATTLLATISFFHHYRFEHRNKNF